MLYYVLMGLLAVVGQSVSQTSGGFDQVCQDIVLKLDCSTSSRKVQCGSDGVTYNTECDFAQANCRNPGLKVLNQGPCSSTTSTLSTPIGMSTTSTLSTPIGMSTTALTTNGPGVITVSPQNPTMSSSPSVTTDGAMVTSTATMPNSTLSVLCQVLVSQACPDDHSPVCGSDLKEYKSLCEFTKARCYDPTLTVLQGGSCSGLVSTTTMTTTTQGDAVLGIICNAIISSQCPDDGVILCGTNKVTYTNSCEFEKAKCQDSDIGLDKSGTC